MCEAIIILWHTNAPKNTRMISYSAHMAYTPVHVSTSSRQKKKSKSKEQLCILFEVEEHRALYQVAKGESGGASDCSMITLSRFVLDFI